MHSTYCYTTNSSDEEHESLGDVGYTVSERVTGGSMWGSRSSSVVVPVKWKHCEHCFHFVPKLICRMKETLKMTGSE